MMMMMMMMMARWRQQGRMPGRLADRWWGRGIHASAHDWCYRRPLCLALPLLHALDQRAYASHTRGEGVHEQWHNSAGQQASKAAVHQWGLLATLTHCLPSEGSQGVPVPGQALFLMGLQYHVHVEDVGGTLREGVDPVLVSASYQLFDDLGLCLG